MGNNGGGEAGASTNNAAPAGDAWKILNEVPFGGAQPGEAKKTREINRAEAASNKADQKFQSANSAVDNAANNVKETHEQFVSLNDSINALREKSIAKEEAIDEIEGRLDSAEAEFAEMKANNGLFNYVKTQTGAAAEILKSGGAVLGAALKKFTAKIVAKMPRIEIQSPIKITNYEKTASKTKADYHAEADAKYQAERPDREKAEGKVDKLKDRTKEFEKSKSNFQEAIEAFRKNKSDRGKLDEARAKVEAIEDELDNAYEEFDDIGKELDNAEKTVKAAEAEYKAAEKEFASAKEKADAAKKVAEEKALRFDRLQTLAQFKEKLGDMSVSQWRHDLNFRKESLVENLELFEGGMTEAQIEKAKARIQLVNDQLKALDVYEEQLAKKKAKPEAAKEEAPVVESAKEEEPAPVAESAKEEEPKAEEAPSGTPESYYRWWNNYEDDEEERRKKATANAVA